MQLFGGGDEFAKKKDVINPNLMQDTAQFSRLNDQNFWINQGGTLSNLLDSLGNKTLVFNSSWNGVISSRHVNKGEIYTLSWNVKTSNSNIKTFVYANDKKYSPDQCEVNFLNYFYDGKAITSQENAWVSQGDTNEHRVAASFLVTQSGVLGVRPESINTDAPYYISSFKLEKGGLPTQWCPAYEDYVMKSDYVTSDITENVMSWEPKTMFVAEGQTHLTISDPAASDTRFTSKFIKVYPNETVSVEVNPLTNKNFLWMYYLVDSPQSWSKVYNPSANWMNGSSTTFNTGNAKYIIFLVGNNDGFTGANTWELKFKHTVNLVIEG